MSINIKFKNILAFVALCAVVGELMLAPLHVLQHTDSDVECALCVASSTPIVTAKADTDLFRPRYMAPLPFQGMECTGFLCPNLVVLPPSRAPPSFL